MNRYDLVLFDFDGTLMDTSRGVIHAAGYTMDHFKLAHLTDKELEVFIGPPFNRQVQQMFDLDEKKTWEITDFFRAYYASEDLLKAELYDGILETIDEIRKRGMKTAVATYKREDYAKRICDAFHFTERMDDIEGGDLRGLLSKNDIIIRCIRNCGITDFSRVLMVGDTANDSDGAKNAGVPFVGALYGFGLYTEEEREASGAVGFIDRPADLLDLI